MKIRSTRGTVMTLLALSLGFAACAPLPLSVTGDKKDPLTKKNASAPPKDGTKDASPSPSPSASQGVSTPSPAVSVAPSVSPSPSASPSVSASPSPSPSASASPSPSPSPTATQTTNNGSGITLRGTVYDEDGATVPTAKVRVRSLNNNAPFDSEVDVISGAYVVNNVPAGVTLEVSASRAGWTRRSRVETLVAPGSGGEQNVINFGGSNTNVDFEGPAYFLSDFPEVAVVEPVDGANNVSADEVSIRLSLSEPLDATNQRLFADAIRVYAAYDDLLVEPGNANPNAMTFDTVNQSSAIALGDAANFDTQNPLFVSEDSTLLGDDDTQATVTWDATGSVATLSFKAPLLSDEDDALTYAIALVAGNAAIEDNGGNELGTGTGGVLGTEATAGQLIQFAFRETNLAVPSGASAPSTANARWLATHMNYTTFEVAEDETDPVLVSVAVNQLTTSTRISMTFSEPMAAYLGGNSGAHGTFSNGVSLHQPAPGFTTAAEADALKSITFAVAETTADLEDIDLTGDTTDSYQSNAQLGFDEADIEFYLVQNAANAVTLSVNPDAPNTLRIEIAGNPNFFTADLNALKVRVEGISDPAGNGITEARADANEKVGLI